MPSNFGDHFSESRREWTARKHRLLKQYVNVAVAKLRLRSDSQEVMLVDGYAGENRYGDEVIGSTHIMVEAAKQARINYGAHVKVFACEADTKTHLALCENLREPISNGILKTFPGTHAENVMEILKLVRDRPTVVFLDPHKPDQMIIGDDLEPWAARRRTTDILGTYFGGSVARMVGGAKAGFGRQKVELVAGRNWESLSGQMEAYADFESKISRLKTFSGLYLLYKERPRAIAYGIFGLSNSAHGFALLNDAVARDFNSLKEKREQLTTASLFSEDPTISAEKELFDAFITVLGPVVAKSPDLKGMKLAVKLFEEDVTSRNFFGRFTEGHFNAARNVIQSRKGNA